MSRNMRIAVVGEGMVELCRRDVGGWAVQWKDPASGQTWKQMATQIRQAHDAGTHDDHIRRGHLPGSGPEPGRETRRQRHHARGGSTNSTVKPSGSTA